VLVEPAQARPGEEEARFRVIPGERGRSGDVRKGPWVNSATPIRSSLFFILSTWVPGP
jgi:hypothetical protein